MFQRVGGPNVNIAALTKAARMTLPFHWDNLMSMLVALESMSLGHDRYAAWYDWVTAEVKHTGVRRTAAAVFDGLPPAMHTCSTLNYDARVLLGPLVLDHRLTGAVASAVTWQMSFTSCSYLP
jgi:hypothetical protein